MESHSKTSRVHEIHHIHGKPCDIDPLIPAYISYLSGLSIDALRSGEEERKKGKGKGLILVNALGFVLGFSAVFILFGAAATVIGTALPYGVYNVVTKVAGVIIVVFGLHTAGVIRIPWLYYEKRFAMKTKATSFFSVVLMGAAFAFGWTPCIGPLLGAILTLAIQGQNIGLSMLLLFVYSMGLAIPFLVTAWMLTTATSRLRALYRHMGLIERVSGAFILIIGVLLVTGTFTVLNNFFNRFMPEWLLTYI